ncbi:MAG: hypothetical protein JO255_10810, partial [Alphaproteobacteria bacterium]|nr:hypothetical protein [Alphaproteobacteria bacterium]
MAVRAGAAARLHLFGIRHHGPGSAHSLLAALDALDPAIVLIEGPPEADELIRFAASPAMKPPVALLVHGQDDPTVASFYPFGIFSPEWQAMRWASARNRRVRFIDLPAANRLAMRGATPDGEAATVTPSSDSEPPQDDTSDPPEAPAEQPTELAAILDDPLAYLATIAGYDDSEAWWNALIEQSANAPSIFAAIETAMTALRAHVDALPPRAPREKRLEDQREAHMRLAIAAALDETEAQVAVVCGAWHVPALQRSVKAGDDRALLKGLPKIKVTATWVPWTDTRLATASGYGAGVTSPGWYAHLWNELVGHRRGIDLSPRPFTARWQARVAGLLRASGRQASTASVIDAARLAETLAALRDLALPGLTEMREASLATLCFGETAPWQLIETELVVGSAVGEIADDVPQMPLQADLTRQQRKLKLAPEALDREVSLDLRSDAGLAKSLLLHRLNLINVPWGRIQHAGASRGTFRENWMLRWDPEFSVRLAETLVHGTTVEQAAGNAAIAAARAAGAVKAIADAVKNCLLAGLAEAARAAIGILQSAAAGTSDIAALAGAIPPLVTVLRYGSAREMPSEELRLLVTSLTEAVCSGLVYACRNLQPDAAEALRATLGELKQHLQLTEDENLKGDWRQALQRLVDDGAAHAVLRGFAARALYDQGAIDAAATGRYLSRALSRAVAPLDASQWLDGFLGAEGQVLLYDTVLTGLIDAWIVELGPDDFTALLPTLRRAFSSIDKAERRRLVRS